MKTSKATKACLALSVGMVLLALYGCGGSDGSSGEIAAATPTISGVAASGAPMAGAGIIVTCSDGKTKTGTADSSGAYSVAVDGCTAPYVLSANTQSGDADTTLVSVYPTTVASGTTVNITPLTHAIAATLASNGQPTSLAANIATEKSNITADAVSTRSSALSTALTPALAQAGLSGTTDLISGKFSADRSGLDKVLDNLKVVVTPSGAVITNVGGAKVDDMGDMNGKTTGLAGDLSSAALTISNLTNFKSDLPKLPATVDDMSIADSVYSALNTCFALPAAQRGSFGASTQAAVCAALPFASDYLHDGKNGAQEFDRYLTSSAYDKATFAKPEIVRFYSNSATDARAFVKFGLMRADGVGEWLTSVVEKSAATGNAWKVRGNQRQFRVFVNGYVVREEQLGDRGTGSTARPKGAYYLSGINLYFGYGEGGAGGAVTSAGGSARGTGKKVAYVKVTGPGLPTGGVVLNPLLSGCDFNFAIATGSAAAPASCTSTYKMQYRKVATSDPDNANAQNSFGSTGSPDYASAAVSDATMAAIQPFSAYQFEIFRVGNGMATADLVYVERMRSRPVTLGSTPGSAEVDKLVMNTGLSDETKNLIYPASGSAFTGGSSFTVKWKNVSKTPPIGSVQIQSRPTGGSTGTFYQDEAGVAFSASSVALSNQGLGWGDMSKATTSGNYNFVQLRTRDQNDTQYFQNWRY